MFKKLLNKINDRLDKFESNTKANYEIGLEKIYNEYKQLYDKVRYLPDFKKQNKMIESQQRTIEALTNALCDKYNHGLFIYSEDGDVPMDNNASERAIRGFCIGKKNWQMIDTINGAKTSAIIYSIAETAKANNLKPYDYFEYLLSEIPNHMDDKDNSFLEDLLPWSENLPEGIRKTK